MDTWVVSDSEFVAGRIVESLSRQGLDCPSTQMLDAHSIGLNAEPLAGARGMVFLCVTQLNDSHFTLLRRLRDTVAPEAKLIVIAPVADQSDILTSVRAGASDILSANDALDAELSGLVSRIQRDSRQSMERGRVLTVVPCQDTSDANILATNLAAVIASPTQTCGVLDFHFRGGDSAMLLKVNPRHTICDLLNQTDVLDDAMFRQALSTHESGIELLAGPTSFSDIRNISVHACQHIIGLAQRCWPVTIVNAEDILHAEQIRALAASDEVLLTMRLDMACLHRVQRHVEFLIRCQVPREHLHVVAMRTGHDGELPVPAVRKVLKLPNVHKIPDDPRSILMSVNLGNPIVRELPKAKPSLAIRSLAESLLPLAHSQSGTGQARPSIPVKAAALLALQAFRMCR